MPYDKKCYELAEHFLSPECDGKLKEDLAQTIQTAIEDWIEENEGVDIEKP